MRGAFITIYGVNNIGKSTQSKILVDRLEKAGFSVVYLKYPIYRLEPSGVELNRILRESGPEGQKISEEELQKLFTKNRQDFEPMLRTILDEGKIVIAEDYTGTGIAWGIGKGLSQDFMQDLNKDLLREDFAILLRGQRSLAVQEKQHIHEQNNELIGKVTEVLQKLASDYKWKVIDLQPKIDDTADIIFSTVSDFLKKFQ